EHRTEAVRALSALLGALGIFGLAKLISSQISALAGAATAAVIAMCPSYTDLTVFDNGTVAIWMGALGWLALMASAYLRRQTALAAFGLGVVMGLVVWARANFLWLIAAIFASTLIVLRGRIRVPLSHWISVAFGGIGGGLPFLIYQAVSKGGTWEALEMF